MQTSIIVPVFNAACYIGQSVESAVTQPETGEIILVEDGSLDNSLDICEALHEKYEKVKLFRHLDGKNEGAAASRNLGMKNAKFDFIAFLDADDYYLPGRFHIAKEIFESDPDCDGVYEAVGIHIEDDAANIRRKESGEMTGEIITMNKVIPPEELFSHLVLEKSGYIHLDGLVFKKNLLMKTGMMEEELLFHQDNDFLFKLAATGRLLPGKLDSPVAIYRVHRNNRITGNRTNRQRYKDRIKMLRCSYRWLLKLKDDKKSHVFLSRIISFCINNKHYNFHENNRIPIEILKRFRLFLLIFEIPEVVFESKYWLKYMPIRILRLIGKNF